MGNASSRFTQNLKLRIIQMNTVREHDMRCGQANVGQVGYVGLSSKPFDDVDLASTLRCVRVD